MISCKWYKNKLRTTGFRLITTITSREGQETKGAYYLHKLPGWKKTLVHDTKLHYIHVLYKI